MPRTGDTYALPPNTAAVTDEVIASAKWNTLTQDLEAEQNAVRPVSAGGTGVGTLPDLLSAIAAVPAADLVGCISAFGGSTPPAGWLECDGSALNRTTYANLFAAIGTSWGAGDGSTTFNLPDFRGEFVRGWDNARGVDASRALGSSQGGAIEAHTHTANPPSESFTTASDTHNHTGTTATDTHNHTVPYAQTLAFGGSGNDVGSSGDTASTSSDSHSHSFTTSSDTHSHSVSVNLSAFTTGSTGGSETRPRNVAAMFIIRY